MSMADVELVIKIPEEDYDYIKRQVADGIFNLLKVCIANGIPLPKGHGKLKDVSEFIPDSDYDDGECLAVSVSQIKSAPTIIEADTEEDEDTDE